MRRSVTIVIPVLNEEAYIANTLSSVGAFVIPKDWDIGEILVIDGGSADATVEIVRKIAVADSRVILLNNSKKIQSKALNIAIDRATGDYLLRLDAHAVYPSDYLQKCIQAATLTNAANVGGVCITMPGGRGYGAAIVQALTTHKFGVGNSGFRVGASAGNSDTVPYGFFNKSVFSTIGKYDERLVRAQDYELNRRIQVAGGKIWMDPEIQVTYYNQSALWLFFKKQVSKEAPYNFYMWYLAPYTFALRHAITAFFTLGVIIGLLLWESSTIRLGYLSVLSVYFLLALLSSMQQAVRYKYLRHLFALPGCFFFFHFLHGIGVLAGGLKLFFGAAPVQQCREPWPGAKQFRAWPPPDGKSWSSNLSAPN